jgi:hypothetical protein
MENIFPSRRTEKSNEGTGGRPQNVFQVERQDIMDYKPEHRTDELFKGR